MIELTFVTWSVEIYDWESIFRVLMGWNMHVYILMTPGGFFLEVLMDIDFSLEGSAKHPDGKSHRRMIKVFITTLTLCLDTFTSWQHAVSSAQQPLGFQKKVDQTVSANKKTELRSMYRFFCCHFSVSCGLCVCEAPDPVWDRKAWGLE